MTSNNSDRTLSDHKYVTLVDLEAAGLTAADVRKRCPGAVEYTALAGPCWLRSDLVPLLGDTDLKDLP
jgi:hypothetical protein